VSLALGIDIGGTFTDIVLLDAASGQQWNLKLLTTPADPADAVVEGAARVLATSGAAAGSVRRVVHATTLFTNALIERKGAPTGLLTTAGFRDVLEIGRERKYDLYDIHLEMPEPLVPRGLRREVRERLSPRGEVEIPIAVEDVLAEGDELVAAGCTSIAITFLHSYANPAHEQQAAAALAARHPRLFVTTSHEVAAEIREYERLSTAVANAYVKPLAERYLGALEGRLAEIGISAPLFLMLSSGGLTHVAEAKRVPIQLLESGPAAGAIAAAHFATLSGERNILAFDMGGTTAKLSVVDDGQPLITYAFEAARARRFREGSGLPLRISSVELIEIGAGGGSIARLDAMGLVKVGPQSAGAEPGPACYDRGGTAPTVTDANLLLGYLDARFFAGGTMAIREDLAGQAVDPLANAAGLSRPPAAHGVHDIVNETMASAARVHIAERGKDLRRYALVTTGGGGPLHGVAVARKLGLGRMIVPPSAGVASAVGLLVAPARVDRVTTVAQPLDAIDWPALEALAAGMEEEAACIARMSGLPDANMTRRRFADMRYAGQGFEILVRLPDGPYDAASADQLGETFAAAYREIYTLNPPGARPEMVNLRVAVTVPADAVTLPPASGGGTDDGLKSTRMARFTAEGPAIDTPVYDRLRLPIGRRFDGPALVEEPESTLLIPPGVWFIVERNGNIVVHLHD
jgi:N-methylhydantoinase A